ncbi:MAG: hypothetical protein H8D45_31995 [Bacteroidetes bacterium]|nr:hypothetical protein [Bacteroidota bacterium]
MSYGYKAGTQLYTESVENKDVLIRIKEADCVNWISVFRGKLLKTPETGGGRAVMTLVDLRKINLDRLLTGADSGDDDKLKVFIDGVLSDSVSWEIGSGTLDRTKINVLSGCGLGKWTLNFEDATNYKIDGPGVSGLAGNVDYGYYGGMTLSYPSITICKGGNYLYSAGLGDLQIIDVSDPKNPSETFKDLNFFVLQQIASAITGTTLVVGFFNIYTVDVSVPATPSISDTLAASHAIWDIKINGNYAYCGCYSGYVDVYDISDPANISLADSLKIGTGIILGISINGNYLYAVSMTDQTVYVIDISTPTVISLTGSLNLGYDCKDISHDGTNHVYITCGTDKALVIVDVSTPASPVKVGELEGTGYPNYLSNTLGIYANGNYAYIISIDENAIAIVDCTTKASPEILEAILSDDGNFTNFGDTYRALFVNGEYVYGYSDNNNLFIYRIAPPITSRPGGNQIRINPPGWGGTIVANDQVIFSTAINFNSVNVAEALYDLEVNYAGVDNKNIHCSSKFGNKNIGTLWRNYTAGETAIKVRIQSPRLIKTGETLTITEGATTEDVAVGIGNGVTSQYPPYIELTIGALANAYTAAAVITWKARGTYDTDFSFDNLRDYCNTNSYNIKLSLDREMTIDQALEAVAMHANCYIFQDKWGIDRVHIFKSYSAVLGTFSKSTNLKLPNPSLEEKEMVNEIVGKYGYDYKQDEDGWKYETKYPVIDSANYGYMRQGFKRQKIVYFPGYWDEDLVQGIIEERYKMWEKGLDLIKPHLTLQGILGINGDHFAIDSDYPVLDTDIEITGRIVKLLPLLDVELIGYDCKFIWKT